MISIFGTKDNGQARVPSMEVNGDELRVNGGPTEVPPIEAQENKPQPDHQLQIYKLPKSKWFKWFA